MMTMIWANIGLGNGLLPDGTKPLPEPMLIFISEVLWHSPESSFKANTQATILHNDFANHTFELLCLLFLYT